MTEKMSNGKIDNKFCIVQTVPAQYQACRGNPVTKMLMIICRKEVKNERTGFKIS